MVKVKKKYIFQPKKVGGRKVGVVPSNKLSVEEHIARGTYRHNRHGERPHHKLLLTKPELKLPRQHVDTLTKKWIKNAADERAVAEGCRFDERYPQYIADCFHTYLKHSKGKWSGQPFDLIDWQANDVVWPLFGWVRPDGYRRFRWVYIEIPKKNGKSTLASGIGIAFLVFDEEPGAEVYSCAADRDQASIVHGEAINMVEASYELQQILKINRTNKNISYKDKRSIYKALSSSIAGKEGYNIHCAICDELHIWKGREVWDALRYGFAAREQPCCFVITTAGEDMQSVCREQHDYAEGVNSGLITDTSFLGVVYFCDEEKWRDEEQWYKANPSLGTTLKIEEFRSAFQQLQVKPTEEPNFKRRRLDIWCTSTKLWIDRHDWKRNEVDLDEAVLNGGWCTVGIDLSKTRDTTSIVLDFPDYDSKENHYLKPFIFLPRDRFEEIKHLINGLPMWVRQGDIYLSEGRVIDYDYVLDTVCQWIDDHNINVHNVVYDPYNAEQFSQDISNRLRCDRVSFGQTVGNYAEPTEDFERLILRGQMHHGKNEMMAWQFGHCQVVRDNGGRYKPIRPKEGDIRTIDTCVASVMAYAMSKEIAANFYDGGGVW